MKTLALFFGLLLSVRAEAAALTVHAAAILTDALKEVAADYQQERGVTVRLNFDASSILARQIEEGAPGDLFISADEAKMDQLAKKSLLAPGTRRTLLTNTLVVVVPQESRLSLGSAADLAGSAVKKIAVAQPSTVPAGIYTKAYLTKVHLWEEIAPKVVPTQNVRAALAAVESGNVEAGFVYKTDALISQRVKIALEISAADGPAITYPVAVLAGSSDLAAAKDFLAYLNGQKARATFQKYGFALAPVSAVHD